jgi:hypothetical protein
MTTGRHSEREITKTTKADGTDPKFPQARFLSITAGAHAKNNPLNDDLPVLECWQCVR